MNIKPTYIVVVLLVIIALSLFAWFNPNNHTSELTTPVLKVSRTFGYGVGDLVEHQISISAPTPYELERNALPQPGPINAWLYLKQIHIDTQMENGLNHYQIQLTYQLFQSVKTATTVDIPALPLRFMDDTRSLSTEIPAWKFNYAPLIPATTSDEAVKIRPTLALPATDLSKQIYSVALLLLAFLITAFYSAWRFDLLPFLRRHPSPFAKACVQLKQIENKQSDPATYLTALKIVHQALNDSAGHTVFFEYLHEFYQQKPDFRTLKTDTERFFIASQQAFFTPTDTSSPLSVYQLEKLCRQYRNIDRLCR